MCIRDSDLRVYQAAMDAAMDIFQLSKSFPAEEKYSLTDQMRRSSRSVCANIGEAWRKRRYRAAFIADVYKRQVINRPRWDFSWPQNIKVLYNGKRGLDQFQN